MRIRSWASRRNAPRQWMCETMADAGFAVERGVCGMPTAFIARAGSGPLHIAICAEYDCLPGIGHACGHNIIAASSAGAAIAAAKVADDAGLTITLLGTPAEEICNAGGKILMLERGAFAGVHAAMMVHPAPVDISAPSIIAAAMFDVHYTGKEAHASAFPRTRHQRRRCADRRADCDRFAAPAYPRQRSHPRHCHQGR